MMYHHELTMTDLLADPMTRALMAADHVDPAELTAEWTALAGRLAVTRAAESRPARVHLTCCHLTW